MAWVRLDDQTPRNGKTLKAGPAACWLWVCGIAHSQSQLTDGFISLEALPMIGVSGVARCRRLADTLVAVGLFDRTEGGYQVHDYLDHNPSRTAVMVKRAEDAERKRRGESERNPSGIHADSGAPRAGVPSHPIPSHPKKKEPSSADADYEAFRQAYPVSRRVGGKLARNAFRSALERTTVGVMLAALEQHKRSEQWQTPKLIPLMTTWLNQERWLQVLPEPKAEPVPYECPHDPHCFDGQFRCRQRTQLAEFRKAESA